jgi:hypothetical protein
MAGSVPGSMNIKYLLAVFAFLVLAACARQDMERSPPADSIIYRGLDLSRAGNYHAAFLIHFEGDVPWSYQLDLRSDGTALEHTLHIEGVDLAQNPGDIRMVTLHGQSRMTGPGTDGDCLVFPADMDISPSFLLPDHIIKPEALNPYLQDLGEDLIDSASTRRYGVRNARLDDWSKAIIDIWMVQPEQYVLRYDLQLTGQDPLFGRGQGRLNGRFVVLSLDPQTINPITDCAPEHPVPESAENLVILPGLIAFDAPETMDGIASFYQKVLPGAGWSPTGEPEQAGDALVLSYQEGEKKLEIVIKRAGGMTHTELLTDE